MAAPTLFADRVDLLLNKQRDALLDLARSRREGGRSYPDPAPIGAKLIVCPSPLEGSPPDPLTDLVGAAQYEHAKIYAQKIAKSVEILVPLIDAIPNQRRRLRILRHVNRLVGCVHDETLKCAVESPAKYTRDWLRMWTVRSPNTRQALQRRERLRPHVEETARQHPSKDSAEIATLLLEQERIAPLLSKRKGDRSVQITRKTLKADIAAILSELAGNPT